MPKSYKKKLEILLARLRKKKRDQMRRYRANRKAKQIASK